MMHLVKDHDVRLAEFLDTAQGLFLQVGYEQTTVAAIIEAVGVSKGAFYHYFASKAELLDAIADRTADQALAVVEPIAANPSSMAIDKLNAVFAASTGFKVREREVILTFLRVLYDERNLRLRKRIEGRNAAKIAPLVARIIRLGVEEGSFSVASPDEAARILLDLGTSLVERMALEALTVSEASAVNQDERATAGLDRMLRSMRGYQEAIERILGADPGSVRFVEEDLAEILMGGGRA